MLLATACSSDGDDAQPGGGSAGMASGTGGAAVSGGTGGRGGGGGTGPSSGGSSTGGNPTGGASSKGGSVSTGGAPSTGGATSSGGSTSTGGSTNTGGSTSSGGSGGGAVVTEKFSFFVTSLGGMRRLSGKDVGFGGDLRFGEATGLAGADKICRTLAEDSLPGAGRKEWRAFLSTATENAIDRVGNGPWYDRLGRQVAASKADLLEERPAGADPAIRDDLPNEQGVPNHTDGSPGCSGNSCPDNHDTLTGSKSDGTWDGESTCDDWTSTEAQGRPRVGHSWPAGSGMNWIQAHSVTGCAAGVGIVQGGKGTGSGSVGALGGYGGIYCFALTP
ncbi:MAG: hypothetical protein M3020_08980 [Myxococcota bacterium]|nr:hypothetical protein [Myxococcota bacterium]